MSPSEARMFEKFLACADRYLEFGSGGSTAMACGLVKSEVTSVDSSAEWLRKVGEHCAESNLRIVPDLIHVNIGQTGDWGYPTNEVEKEKWHLYYSGIWSRPSASNADLYMVDGRFRVACFMQAVLHCEQGAVIMVHDFRSRESYHVVRDVAREIAFSEELSAFVPRPGVRKLALEILDKNKYNLA
jgi:hypothetical protein